MLLIQCGQQVTDSEEEHADADPWQTDSLIPLNLSWLFDSLNVEGTFVAYDSTFSQFYLYNEELADIEFAPASTFKIIHNLMALEKGIVRDTNQVFKWDGEKMV
jgi:beta-lactamase class D